MSVTSPSFTHLRRLTDDGGLFEHAEGIVARREHGYCVDDVARALVVVCREVSPTPEHRDLRAQYLAFVLESQAEDGRFRNRRGTDLSWSDEPSVEDCWGRALWGLGVAAAGSPVASERRLALEAFSRGARWVSPHSRAMAFAALGAAEILLAHPRHAAARALLDAAVRRIGRPASSPGLADVTPTWPWPEPRFTYANAVLPDALIAAGVALPSSQALADGLQLLRFLLDEQVRDGHLSVVPVGGRGPTDRDAPDRGPQFDQQPIEVASLADACARAFAATSDERWLDGIEMAVAWFFGANDVGTSLVDEDSGGGCDGLEWNGRNENQGAESTLALMSTLQQTRWLDGRAG